MAHVTSPGGSVVASSAQPHLRRERLFDRCSLTRDKRGRVIVAAGMSLLKAKQAERNYDDDDDVDEVMPQPKKRGTPRARN